jgi:MFS family permease
MQPQESIDAPGTLQSPAGQASRPSASTSQAFHQELPPDVLRRSLIISVMASSFGMIFFGIIQGTVLNFFLEDLNLKDRIPWFFGLWWLAGAGSCVGSWIQERWGYRRALLFTCCGLTRLTWLFIGFMPLIWPERIPQGRFFWWMSAAIVFFYFLHSVGANAWLMWMADLVPARLQSRYWSLRQVGTSGFSALSKLFFGYYLEQHRNMKGYALVFGVVTLFGVLDVALFFFVAHRPPRLHAERQSILAESIKRLKEVPYRRLCAVYLLWSAANCIMTPTVYYIMRDHVVMGVAEISLVMTISQIGYTLFSLYWGRFAEREGHRRGLLACLVLQNACTIFYLFCGRGTEGMATVASTVEQIGWGGVNLFMFPMLIDYTKGKGGGRAVGMAAFCVLLSVANFIAFGVADRHLYNWLSAAFSSISGGTVYSPGSWRVYVAAMWLAFGLRGSAIFLALLLPPCERQLAAGPATLILRRMSEGPMRAAQAVFGKF